MCGFCGLIGNEIFNLNDKLIKHRGPDSEYKYLDENIFVKFYRLKINGDDIEGIQPFKDSQNNLYVWGNGEIYNFKELALKYNIKINNNCDLSILPELFSNENVSNILKEIRGFFSLIIYDKRKQKVYLAIDHFGIKPLYYKIENNSLLFSSELRIFPKKIISSIGVKHFFEIGATIPPLTLNEEVKQLGPSEILEYDLKDRITKIYKYWEIKKKEIGEKKYSVENIKNNLEIALKRNSLSDYPIINLLSGGVDSTFLALFGKGIVKNIYFNFGNLKNDLEKKNIEILKSKVPVQEIKISTDYLKDFLEYIKASDEPVYDFAGFVYYNLMKEIKKLGYRVVWNGTGGDELFFGYNRYNNITWLKNLGGKLVNKTPLYNPYDFLKKGFLNKLNSVNYTINEFTKNDFGNQKEYFRFIDFQYYLPNTLLRYTDRISSYHNIESRVPFLDVDLVESVFYSSEIPKNIGKKEILTSMINEKIYGLNFNFKEGLGLPIEKIITQYQLNNIIIPKIICSNFIKNYPTYENLIFKNIKKRKNIWNIMGLYSLVLWYEN